MATLKELQAEEQAIKLGRRNSAVDVARLKQIQALIAELLSDEIQEDADEAQTPQKAYRLGAVKAAGDWELDVLGVPFGGPDGGKDLEGEWFSTNTKLHLDQYPTPLVAYYHGYGPDRKPMGEPEFIGRVVGKPTVKADGVWWRVILDKTNQFAKRIWEAAKAGLARASSGSIAQFVRVADNGEITSWPVAEISLIDEQGKRLAANPYAVALPAMRAHFEKAGIVFPVYETEPEAKGTGADSAPIAGKSNQPNNLHKGLKAMTPEEMQKLIDAIVAAVKQALGSAAPDAATQSAKVEDVVKAHFAKMAEAQQATDAQKAQITEAVKAAQVEWEKKAAEANRLPGGFPAVAKDADTWKYDNLSPADHALLVDVMKAKGLPIPQASMKALMLKCVTDDLPAKDRAYVRSSMKACGIEPTEAAVKTTANVMYTTGSGHLGEDWVGTAYAQQIWDTIRAETTVVAKIPEIVIPDGFSSEYFPLVSADPTFYKVPQAYLSDDTALVPLPTIPASYPTTAQKQITIAKMGARVLFSGEMTEDTLVPFIPQLKEQLSKAGAEQLEHAVIDGDATTTGSTNINDIGNASTQTATNLYLMFDGFRKLALVTNTANSRSASGALSIADYAATLQLMGTAGINAADITKVGFIVSAGVWWANMLMPEVMTRDTFSGATIEQGFLTRAFGYPIQTSAFMHFKSTTRKANTAGKVDQTTVANNTTGAILAVRWDQWKFAYKRRMTIETTRFANSDSWEIVALARVGLAYRDTEASAISYNVGV